MDLFIRQLTEHLPANSAAAKLLRIIFDDNTGTVEGTPTAVAKQNTIGAVLDLIYAQLGAVGSSNLTMSTARMLGRITASTGAIEEITIGAGLALSAGALTAEVTTDIMNAAISAAVTGLFDFKGNTDCSGNPNFPAASKSDLYRVSVAGKIGGASGTVVSVGDWYVALADNAGGTLASVGASWSVWEGNIPGITAAGLAMIQAADAAAQRALLGLGTMALQAAADYIARSESVPVSLTYASTITPAIVDGLYRKVAMTGNLTMNAPSGTPTDGMKWKGRFTADASPRDLTLHAAIKIPSASTFTGTKTIAAGEMWMLQIEYDSALSAWILQSLVGGWA